MKMGALVGSLLLSLFVLGCGKAPPAERDSSRVVVNGVEYTIAGARENNVDVVNGELRYSGGGLTVSARGGRLTVNGKRYGPVRAGDRVAVDREGTVTVNGGRREPEG
jgi:hypothetical protein